jgi:biopolymer transport protein ExbD
VLLLQSNSISFTKQKATGFWIALMPTCQPGHQHRSATDFMGNSVTLEINSSGSLAINGEALKNRSWIDVLERIFSTRADKTLLIEADEDVQMDRIFQVLHQLDGHVSITRVILLAPQQIKDIGNEFCVLRDPR